MFHNKANVKHVNIVAKSYQIARVAVTQGAYMILVFIARHESAVSIDKIATIARVSQV